MKLPEAISVMDVLVESGDDRERDAWRVVRRAAGEIVALVEMLEAQGRRQRLDRVAWGDGSAEHDE